jgi:LPPG:FO 2-phospho-L-lactate transferase
VSPFGVAQLYRGLLSGMVIDRVDAGDAPRIEALGMRVLVTETVMQAVADRVRLAEDVLHFAQELASDVSERRAAQ